jgi:hypothetical protein
MENIHILGTDNPSRLHWYGDGFFGLSKLHLPWKEGKNIYITNDDEVNRLDYYIGGDEPILAVAVPVSHRCKKVIMTTDQELIRDGVQAIDDEFLEWFIKNPSCERVKVYALGDNKYDMVVPQVAHEEEPKRDLRKYPLIPNECYKQETLEEAAAKLNKHYETAKWQQEQDKNNYSEEDMKLAYKTGARLALISQSDLALRKGKFPTPEEWFEQFKNI